METWLGNDRRNLHVSWRGLLFGFWEQIDADHTRNSIVSYSGLSTGAIPVHTIRLKTLEAV
jgi:hypothetical protein